MKRCRRLLSVAALALCLILLAGWTLGRTVSDRFIWSQYLAWMPSILAIPLAAILLCAAALLAIRTRARRLRRALAITLLWLLIAGAHLCFIDLRLYRLPLPARPATPHLRILHWNITGIEWLDQITVPLLAQRPDIAVLVNPHSSVSWRNFPAAVAPEYQVINTGGVVIVSRVPIDTYGMTWLGLQGLPADATSTQQQKRAWVDPGRAMFIELRWQDRPVNLWMIDLPSEPRLSRWRIAHDAAATIRGWSGRAMSTSPRSEDSRFPAPDIVVGDFNNARNAASLSILLPDMRNAYDLAGAGYAATWPGYGYMTPIPLAHVDQMFIAPTMKALRYEVVGPRFGYHCMQVGDFAAAH